MTFKKAVGFIVLVLIFNWIGAAFGLYALFPWYDMPMHLAGGFAIGALALAIWHEGVEDVKFKGWLAKHLKWWLVPLFVLSFTALVATIWEFHEFILDILLSHEALRQVSLEDTMIDFFLGLVGAMLATLTFHRNK